MKKLLPIDSIVLLIFNHEQIEIVYFIGFQDKEELEYNREISEYVHFKIILCKGW